MTIQDAYNIWSQQYDSNENKTRDLDIKSTSTTLSKYNFKSVLELGCGTGKNTVWLLQNADHVIGIDFSENMLAIAKSKISAPHVTFIKADITKDWEIENQSVDLVTSCLTLEHIKNLNHIFHQANLKLKNSGLFFMSELHPYKQYQGSKARFPSENGEVALEVYTHHISEYLQIAKDNNFKLQEINEWFDDDSNKTFPRLISFVFRKN